MNLKKYINLPLNINRFGEVEIDDNYLTDIIIDNIEFGCTYNYNIITPNSNNPLTKNSLPYDDLLYTLFNADILSILADLSVGIDRVELTREFEDDLLSNFLEKGSNMVIDKDTERLFKVNAIDICNGEYGHDIYDLKQELNSLVSESDLVKNIFAEKGNMFTEKGLFLSNNGYVLEKAFKDLKLSLVYHKHNF